MTMLKDMAKMKEWVEETGKFLDKSATLLGSVSDQNLVQGAALPPLRVLKFYTGHLRDMLSKDEPKKASIGDSGDMYSIPDNVVPLRASKKRAERWDDKGEVRLLELE